MLHKWSEHGHVSISYITSNIHFESDEGTDVESNEETDANTENENIDDTDNECDNSSDCWYIIINCEYV